MYGVKCKTRMVRLKCKLNWRLQECDTFGVQQPVYCLPFTAISSNDHYCLPSILSQYSTLPRRKRNGILVTFSSLYSLSQKNGKCWTARFAGNGAGTIEKGAAGNCSRVIFLLTTLSAGGCACTEKNAKESNKNIAIIFNILVIIACKYSLDN